MTVLMCLSLFDNNNNNNKHNNNSERTNTKKQAQVRTAHKWEEKTLHGKKP